MRPNSHESDPAIDAARATEQEISRRFEAENTVRADILAITEEGRVPSYEQLKTAQEWVGNIRDTAAFDADGKLIQNSGLIQISIEDLDKIEDHFDSSKWTLTPRELTLAKSITDTYHGNKIEKLKLLAGVSPRFGTELSKDLSGVSTTERYDRIQAMTDDISAMIKLDLAIRKSSNAPEDPQRATDSSLFDLNVDKAIHELQKKGGPVEKGIRSDEESVTGLTFVQKNAVLEQYGHKQKPQKYSEINSKFKADEAERSGTISGGLRKVGINKLPNRGGSRKEKIRRFINGTETKPAVASRHKLETTVKLATEKLKDGELSSGEQRRLEKRIGKAERRINRGSRINSNKYGEAASRKGAERDNKTYDPAQLLDGLQKIKAERDSIEDGNFARQVHAALKREANSPEKAVNIDLRLNNESFNEILSAIGQRFDQLLESQRSLVKPGERVRDSQIDAIYIESQLLVAQEIAKDYFAARNIKLDPSIYSKYVRQLLEVFHAYTPETPNTKQANSTARPSPATMPKKSRISKEEQKRAEQAVADNAARTAIEA